MDNKSRLKTAQTEMLESLANLENHLADMYAAFAARFESSRPFWLKISRDEASHARMVLSLKRQLDAGFHFWNLEAFRPDAVKQQIKLLDQIIARVRQPKFTEVQALDIAIAYETSILDAEFYDTAQSNAPEFGQIASILANSTRAHRQRLLEQQATFQTKSAG